MALGSPAAGARCNRSQTVHLLASQQPSSWPPPSQAAAQGAARHGARSSQQATEKAHGACGAPVTTSARDRLREGRGSSDHTKHRRLPGAAKVRLALPHIMCDKQLGTLSFLHAPSPYLRRRLSRRLLRRRRRRCCTYTLTGLPSRSAAPRVPNKADQRRIPLAAGVALFQLRARRLHHPLAAFPPLPSAASGRLCPASCCRSYRTPALSARNFPR